MSSENKKDKFKFVTMEEVSDKIEKKLESHNISIVDTPSTVNVSKFDSDEVIANEDDYEEENTEKVNEVVVDKDEVKKTIKSVDKDLENDVKGKFHFSFEARIITMIVLILIMFCGACALIYKAISYKGGEKISYREYSNTTYEVFYNEAGGKISLDEGLRYDRASIEKITPTFNYNVEISEDIDYKLSYHVSAIVKMYNKYDNSRIIYNNEETLINKTDISDTTNKITIEKTVSVDYPRYVKEINDYKTKYAENADSSLEIVLYLDEPTETRKVSSIKMPLNESVFSINKYDVSNEDRMVTVNESEWNKYNTLFAGVASVLIIISLVLIYKTTYLVLTVTYSKNNYQQKLSQILRDYDRIIVIARDGYESNVEKEVVKVNSFDELLDIKDNLNKPIIFSKVNDIKSEFIVEDEDKLYKFVLKEFD